MPNTLSRNRLSDKPPPRYSLRFQEPDDQEAIRRFNERLASGGTTYKMLGKFTLPGEHLAPQDHFHYRRRLLVWENDEVRGGLLLQYNRVNIRGKEHPFCWLQLPISEGLVNRRYGAVVFLLLKQVLQENPLAMGLGVGSLQETWAKVLIRMGFRYQHLAFFFCPVNLPRVATGLRYLDSRKMLQIVSRLGAFSGLASAAGLGFSLARKIRIGQGSTETSVVEQFDSWADEIYSCAAAEYGAIANRQSTTLNIFYLPDDRRYIRIRVQSKSAGKEVGWIIVVHKKMQNDAYFGDLHVGTLVNGCCRLEDVELVVGAGVRYLVDQDVDLIISNWSHKEWGRASRRLGFLSGPSNFVLYVSPNGRPILESNCPLAEIHMTRGDGDVPSKLMPLR